MSNADWETLVEYIEATSSEMFFDMQDDGNEPPFSIEATDADGNIIATLLLESDGKGGIASVDSNFNRQAFTRVPVFLTLRTTKGMLRRTLV